jgi:cyclophilin family peptidyl-prolyl cis-trans isomerase
MNRRSALLACAAAAVATPALAQPSIQLPAGLDRENALVIELKDGPVIVRLRPDLAPAHVERVKTLVRRGFYDNIVFHRVIEGFMAQTGDPRGDGTGGSDLPNLRAEFSRTPFNRGTLGMARAQDPNSANSQFFIMFAPAPHLNNQYTVFGEVVSGMEAVDRIKRGVGQGGSVPPPQDRMIRVRVAADIRS